MTKYTIPRLHKCEVEGMDLEQFDLSQASQKSLPSLPTQVRKDATREELHQGILDYCRLQREQAREAIGGEKLYFPMADAL